MSGIEGNSIEGSSRGGGSLPPIPDANFFGYLSGFQVDGVDVYEWETFEDFVLQQSHADLSNLGAKAATQAPAAGTINNGPIGPTDSIIVRYDTTAGAVIYTGFDCTNMFNAAGYGKVVILSNDGPNSLTIKHQNTGSTATNRVISPGGADFVITSGNSGKIFYDKLSDRWRVL